MKKRILPLLVVSALSLGIGVTTLTSCDVEIPVEAGPDFTDSKPVSVVSIEKTGTSGLVDTYTITYSDGTTSTFTVTNGADGEDGKDGATGATGETGPQGPQGIQGEKGEDGHTPVVTIGANGNWVIDGVDSGISAAGVKGDKGDKGDTGETGPQGPKGDKGDTGATGPQGPQGEKGEDGADGTSFLNGATDPTSETGKDGDTYLNYVTLDLFVKVDGSWLYVNNLHGSAGSEFIRAEGIPTDDVGKDGDTYLDTVTMLIYEKEGGHWSVIGELNVTPHVHTFGDPAIRENIEAGTMEIYHNCVQCGESEVIKSTVKQVYAEVELDTNLGEWTQNEEGWWVSPNAGVNSSDKRIQFVARTSGKFKFDYDVSSEKNWDKFYLKHNSTDVLGPISGTVASSYELEIVEGDKLEFRYTKDSSGANGRDDARFKFAPGQSTYNILTFANVDEEVVGDTSPLFILNGEIQGELPTITKTGDTQFFDGWYLDSEFSTPLTSTTALSGDIVAYAKWLEPVKVTLDMGYDGVKEVHNIRPGTAITPDDPIREGYNFVAFYEDEALTTRYTGRTLDENITLHAKWVSEADTHALFGTWKGYFLHSGSASGMSYASIVVEATGDYTIRTACSTYVSGTIGEGVSGVYSAPASSGTQISDIYVDGNVMVVSENTTFTKSGYTFILFKDFDGFDSSSEISVTNFTFESPSNAYALTYLKQTVNGEDIGILFDFRDSANPTWHIGVTAVDEMGNTIAVSSNTSLVHFKKGETPILSLFATYSGSSKVFTSTHDSLEGTYTCEDGASISLTGTGYLTLSGIKYTTASGSESTATSTSLSSSTTYTVDAVNSNVIYLTYSALIRKVITLDTTNHTFTYVDWVEPITFDLGYKANAEDTENVKFVYQQLHGSTIWFDNIPYEGGTIAAPTREGYVFDGWYEDEACSGTTGLQKYSPTGPTTLYAKWVLPVTVTAHLNNGEENVVYSDKPKVSITVDTPTRDGYKFMGWYTDEGLTTAWDGKTTDTDINIYAKWEEFWDYTGYVGTYTGGEVWSSNKNKTPSVTTVTVEEDGTVSGRVSGTLAGAINTESGRIDLANGKKCFATKAADGRAFLITHYNGFGTNYVTSDVNVGIRIADGESATLTYTQLNSGVWAVEFVVTTGTTSTTYRLLVHSGTTVQEVYTDVDFVVDGVAGSALSAIYDGSNYASSVVVKKGETEIYTK